ncbi:hypothetical protein [uncultured Campylobacter sp.]|uniref:hypothetical protein n=1 Tax=uncultured Campylobacter sp. TaxID=218934 RepID=UPI002602BB92|nr:hypothetical protein [uncultured Campylobacter sp.]
MLGDRKTRSSCLQGSAARRNSTRQNSAAPNFVQQDGLIASLILKFSLNSAALIGGKFNTVGFTSAVHTAH